MRSTLFIASSFVLTAIANPNDSLFNLFAKRQLPSGSTLPQCSDQCQSIESTVNSCTDSKCFCSSQSIQNLAACFQCTVNAVGDATDYQSTINQIIQSCATLGVNNLPSETLTGPTGSIAPTASAPSTSSAPSITVSDSGSPTSTGSDSATSPTQSSGSKPSGALGMGVPHAFLAIVLAGAGFAAVTV